jgi:hypothetical protein
MNPLFDTGPFGKAFQHCASYDSVVSEYMWTQIGEGAAAPERSVPMTLIEAGTSKRKQRPPRHPTRHTPLLLESDGVL